MLRLDASGAPSQRTVSLFGHSSVSLTPRCTPSATWIAWRSSRRCNGLAHRLATDATMPKRKCRVHVIIYPYPTLPALEHIPLRNRKVCVPRRIKARRRGVSFARRSCRMNDRAPAHEPPAEVVALVAMIARCQHHIARAQECIARSRHAAQQTAELEQASTQCIALSKALLQPPDEPLPPIR